MVPLARHGQHWEAHGEQLAHVLAYDFCESALVAATLKCMLEVGGALSNRMLCACCASEPASK